MSQALFPSMEKAMQGSLPESGCSWMQQSVQQFFSSFHWDNQPLQVQQAQHSEELDDDALPSLQLTVNQFFSTIAWEGSLLSPPAGSPPEIAPASTAFTLDDFSELF